MHFITGEKLHNRISVDIHFEKDYSFSRITHRRHLNVRGKDKQTGIHDVFQMPRLRRLVSEIHILEEPLAERRRNKYV